MDEILGGDLAAGFAYLTPAKGVVITPMAPLGLRDRETGHGDPLHLARALEEARPDPPQPRRRRRLPRPRARPHGSARLRPGPGPRVLRPEPRSRVARVDHARVGPVPRAAVDRSSWGARSTSTTGSGSRSRSRSSASSPIRRPTPRACRRCSARIRRRRPTPQSEPKGGTGPAPGRRRRPRRTTSDCRTPWSAGAGPTSLPKVVPVRGVEARRRTACASACLLARRRRVAGAPGSRRTGSARG